MAIKYNMIKQKLAIQKEKSPGKGTRKRYRGRDPLIARSGIL